MVIAGGWDGDDRLDSSETFDPLVGSWVTSGAKLPRTMNGLRAANINGRVLIFGNDSTHSTSQHKS